jgi:hypothetical protein
MSTCGNGMTSNDVALSSCSALAHPPTAAFPSRARCSNCSGRLKGEPEQSSESWRKCIPFGNIEEALKTIEALASPEENELSRYVERWRDGVGDKKLQPAVRELRDTAIDQLFKWLRVRKDPSYLNALFRFASSGDALSDEHAVDVFSLNYDLAVEQACAKRSIPCRTGFSDGDVPYEFDPRDLTKPGVRLYKLHGSINWGVAMEKKDQKPDFSEVLAIPPFWFRRSSRPFYWNRVFTEPFHFHTLGGPMVGMIFGVRDKTETYRPYLELQQAFNNGLELAKALVVIGYSWSDPYINRRIERQVFAKHDDLFVIDIGWDALANAKDPKRSAEVYVGRGAKAALTNRRVDVAVCYCGNVASMSVEGGLVGALGSVAKLYREERTTLARGARDEEFDEHVRVTERLIDKLLKEGSASQKYDPFD